MIPVATVGLNHHMTMRIFTDARSPTLRFPCSARCLTQSLRSRRVDLAPVGRATSTYPISIASASRSLRIFHDGDFRFDVYRPALTGREWRYASLIKLHFWASAYGIGLMTLMLLAGGFLQGSSMEDPSLVFSRA